MSRVLVVEDEAHLATGIKFNLELEGYEVEVIGEVDVQDALPLVKPVKSSYQRGVSLKELVAAAERDIIIEALAANAHHISNTAKELGLERSHLYKKMRALGINPRSE